VVDSVVSDTELDVSPNFVETESNITYHVNNVGMRIEYLDGQKWTDWANSTLYVANDVVYNAGGTIKRWYITAAGGTSNGTEVDDDVGVTDWTLYSGERQIGTTYYAFNGIIEGKSAVKEKIYEFAQYQLRQDLDIDETVSGTQNGKVANRLLRFVGDTLVTYDGVYIDNFSAVDTNAIEFYDVGGTKRTFPYVAAGNLLFNDYLVNDTDAIYRVYFTTNPAGDYGTTNAVLVNDNGGTAISGSVTSGSISFDFDYDNNTQGGRSAETDADVTAVAIGLSTGQFVKATGTFVRSTANSVSLVAALERNYSNPS